MWAPNYFNRATTYADQMPTLRLCVPGRAVQHLQKEERNQESIMGRKVTDEMKRAMRLIKRKVNPLTPYAAAQAVNIEPSTIYRSKLYKDYLQSQKQEEQAAE